MDAIIARPGEKIESSVQLCVIPNINAIDSMNWREYIYTYPVVIRAIAEV